MPSSWKTSALRDHVGRNSQSLAEYFVYFVSTTKCFGICPLPCVEGNEVSVPLQAPAAVLHQSVGGEGMEELPYTYYSKAITA